MKTKNRKLSQLPERKIASIDTVFTFPVLQIAKIKGIQHAIEFNNYLLYLPLKPRKPYVEITARELILCFSRH